MQTLPRLSQNMKVPPNLRWLTSISLNINTCVAEKRRLCMESVLIEMGVEVVS
jgi:hypothetical protein